MQEGDKVICYRRIDRDFRMAEVGTYVGEVAISGWLEVSIEGERVSVPAHLTFPYTDELWSGWKKFSRLRSKLRKLHNTLLAGKVPGESDDTSCA